MDVVPQIKGFVPNDNDAGDGILSLDLRRELSEEPRARAFKVIEFMKNVKSVNWNGN